MLFLALALPAIYAYAPSLEGVAKPRWLGAYAYMAGSANARKSMYFRV